MSKSLKFKIIKKMRSRLNWTIELDIFVTKKSLQLNQALEFTCTSKPVSSCHLPILTCEFIIKIATLQR